MYKVIWKECATDRGRYRKRETHLSLSPPGWFFTIPNPSYQDYSSTHHHPEVLLKIFAEEFIYVDPDSGGSIGSSRDAVWVVVP
jgi:hypothetical protein